MFERILVPLDGTPLAEQALGPAASLSRATGAELHLATVLMPTLMGLPDIPDDATPGATQSEYLDNVLERVKGAGVANASAKLLRSDHVVEGLEEYRKEVGADLTVMCTHGRGPVERAWLGSVADRLVRASDAPILLVRGAAPEERPDVNTEFRFRRILVPLDGSHLSRQALDTATKLAPNGEAVFVLTRIIEPPHKLGSWWLPDAADRTPTQVDKARAVAQAKLDLEVQAFGPGHKVEAVTEFASPVAKGILDMADTHDADVIVIATHGRKGVGRLMLGSVADKVIRGANRPVLLVRPKEA